MPVFRLCRHVLAPSTTLAIVCMLSVSACGGEIAIGKAGPETEPENGPGPSAPSTPPSESPAPVSCSGAQATPQTLVDAKALGGEIADFVTDDSRVFVALSSVASQGGRILELHQGSTNEVANTGPDKVYGLGLTLGSIAFGLQGGDPNGSFVSLERPAGTRRQLDVPKLERLATHPARPFLAYGEGSEVLRWDLPKGGAHGAPAIEMKLEGRFFVRSVAVTATTMVALGQNTLDDRTEYHVLVRSPATPGDQAHVMATFEDVTSASNVVADATHAYFMWNNATAQEQAILYRVPLDANDGPIGPEHIVARFAGEDLGAELALDDTHVYVARSGEACPPPGPCMAQVTISRVAKAMNAPQNEPVVLKTFEGPQVPRSTLRSIKVDACALYWQDGKKLYRQATSAL